MNNFPKHWQVKKLTEICEKISAGGDKPDKFSPTKTDEFQIPIYSNGIKDDGLYGYTNFPTIDKKAVTISARGTIGFVCVRNEPFCPIIRLITAIPDDKILNLNFLAYALKYKIPLSEGSSIPQLTLPNFRQIKIPLPLLDEQSLIVKKIEDCFEKIDFAVLKLQKSKELIEIYKQSVLSYAFNGKLTNSNLNSWQIKKLGEISNYGKAKQINSENLKNTDWILGLEDIEKETGRLIKKVSFESIKSKSNKLIFNKGDILFGTLRPYLKKFLIADDNGYCTTEIMPFTTGNKITNLYVLFYLKSNIVENFISSVVYGTRMPRFGVNHGKNLEIPLPPLYEQNLIVLQIEKRFKVADNALNLIEQSLQKAEFFKQSILSKAFNGELIKDKNE